jgi:hypothetical protein
MSDHLSKYISLIIYYFIDYKMRRNIYKPTNISAYDSYVGFRDIFNRNPSECTWPAGPLLKNTPCNFNFTTVKKSANFDIIELPKGTLLYHATKILSEKWYESQFPLNTTYGGVWFASTPEHALNFTSATHILKYTLTQNVNLIFIRNLKSRGADKGYDYTKSIYRYDKEISKEYHISGYIGCNECEIFLENGEIKQVLGITPQIVKERSLKYTD